MIKLTLWLLLIGLGLWYMASPQSLYSAMDGAGLKNSSIEMFEGITEGGLIGGEGLFNGILEMDKVKPMLSSLGSSLGKSAGYLSFAGLSLAALFFFLKYIFFRII